MALSVPGVMLEEGTVYTIFAMGLAGGEPALTAVPSVDASYDAPMPATMPTTGGETTNLWLMAALGAGLALIAGGLFVRFRPVSDNHIQSADFMAAHTKCLANNAS